MVGSLLSFSGLRHCSRFLRGLAFKNSLRNEVLWSFSAVSTVLVVVVLSVSGGIVLNTVRLERRANVSRHVASLRSAIEGSRFLPAEQQRQNLQSELNEIGKSSSDVFVVRFSDGEVFIPPNWFLIPQDRLRLQLLGQLASEEGALRSGLFGDRYEAFRYQLSLGDGFIDVYRNITLEDRIIFGYVLQVFVFALIVVVVVVVVGLWLSSRIVEPVLRLDRALSGLSPERLAESQVSIGDAPLELANLADSATEMAHRLGIAWDNQKMFVSAVSHEFRNSMTVILGYLSRVQRGQDPMTPKQQKAIRVVLEESERLTRMFEQLLKIARADMAQEPIALLPVNLAELVRDLVDSKREIAGREIELSIEQTSLLSSELCVEVEPDTLSQVLANLIENAFKYSDPGSLVSVRLRCKGDVALISVVDQGIGIPEADQSRIFDRFFRASNASAYASGTGLGLALDRLLAQRMGGSLVLASSSAEGSCFDLSLPLLKQGEAVQ